MINFYRLDIKLKPSSLKPHIFIGSTLRGAFGVSLKKEVCVNPLQECEGCFAKENCIYYDFFEEKNKAHAYRFDFELSQDSYDFGFYLFESATNYILPVSKAFVRMFSQEGITKQRVKLEIESINVFEKRFYHEGSFQKVDIKPKTFEVQEIKKDIKVLLKTPLRTKSRGKLLNTAPSLELLLTSVQNRLNELKGFPKTKLSFTPKYKTKSSDIAFLDLSRRSNRQKRSLQIGGIVGFVEFLDVDAKSFILLKLGELIGVGKQTVFGLGKIEVVLSD